MTPKKISYDIAFIGATNAGLAAAACIAKAGGRCVVIETGVEKKNELSSDCPPNSVWRRLDLGSYGVDLEPVEALISIRGGDILLQTYDDANKTQNSVEDRHAIAGEVLNDFFEAGRRFSVSDRGPQVGGSDKSVFEQYATGSEISGSSLASANEILDDFFADDAVKGHFAFISLMQFGLTGDEPGSAVALGSGYADATWRVRSSAGAVSLKKALQRVCNDLAVEMKTSQIDTVKKMNGSGCKIQLDDDTEIAAAKVIVSDENIAHRLGLVVNAGGSPIAHKAHAEATVMLSFTSSIELSDKTENCIHFLANDGRASLRRAVEAAAEGIVTEDMPISFEANGKSIRVIVPYLPKQILSEGDWRDWSGQDRQALGSQVLGLIAPYIKGGRSNLSRIDVSVHVPEAKSSEVDSTLDVPIILMPAPHHDKIDTLVNFALQVFDRE